MILETMTEEQKSYLSKEINDPLKWQAAMIIGSELIQMGFSSFMNVEESSDFYINRINIYNKFCNGTQHSIMRNDCSIFLVFTYIREKELQFKRKNTIENPLPLPLLTV